jgi:hypothetical protein
MRCSPEDWAPCPAPPRHCSCILDQYCISPGLGDGTPVWTVQGPCGWMGDQFCVHLLDILMLFVGDNWCGSENSGLDFRWEQIFLTLLARTSRNLSIQTVRKWNYIFNNSLDPMTRLKADRDQEFELSRCSEQLTKYKFCQYSVIGFWQWVSIWSVYKSFVSPANERQGLWGTQNRIFRCSNRQGSLCHGLVTGMMHGRKISLR